MDDYITAAVEGLVDEAVAKRICTDIGLSLRACYVKNGKQRLDSSLHAYNSAARFGKWLVIRDLDQDAQCPAALNSRLCPNPVRNLCLRVAVRAVESWFPADVASLAAFLAIPSGRIPLNPELLDDPKLKLINLAFHSKKKDIRLDITPADPWRREGPAYASRMIEFALYHWNPTIAARNSESLARCLAAVQRLRLSA